MLVSCLMVMHPAAARRPRQRRALEAYLAQGHAERELVVVIDRGRSDDRADAAAMIAALGGGGARIVLPEQATTLGGLRNMSVAAARGDILCQWDDDDLHHPDRVARQLAALAASGCEASILEEVMLYREAEAALYLTRWTQTPAGGHPATLICTRRAAPSYPESGPSAATGEDLAVAMALEGQGQLHRHGGEPHLYTYVSHDANTSGAAHHALLAETLALSSGLVRRREGALRAGLAPIAFGRAVEVRGANGAAFTL